MIDETEPKVPEPEDDEVWTVAPMHDISGNSDDLFALHRRPMAATQDEYMHEVRRYIELKYRVRHLGTAMVDLNRRFSHLTKRFGISVLGIVQLLNQTGVLSVQPHRGNLIAFPAQDWHNLTLDPLTGPEAGLRVCDDTLRDIGKVIPVAKEKTPPKGSSFW